MRDRIMLTTVSLVFAGLTVFLGYFVQRVDFQTYILSYGLFFSGYIWVAMVRRPDWALGQLRYLTGLGIALRIMLLFSLPNFSDDYARFLWDGHLTVAGIHPFAHPPRYFVDQQISPPGITVALFEKLNSSNYFTVYPPVCQLVFALAVWLFPVSEQAAVFVLKLFLFCCELGTLRLLWGMERQKEVSGEKPAHASILVYALNPLAILEITGNCHFEGAMIFFLLIGLLRLSAVKKTGKAAICWALATACKILPVMFLPIAWKWLGWRKGLYFMAVFGLVCLVLFAPIWTEIPHMLDSLDLYFRQFQFNASFYYLVRAIGFTQTGWDIGEYSGPVLGVLSSFGVLWIALNTRTFSSHPAADSTGRLEHLSTQLLLANLLYLAFSATVQPWYVCVPLALSLNSGLWRVGVAWSGLVALSYSHYDGGGLKEHFGLIGLEYVLLGCFLLWEFRQISLKKAALISS